MNKKATTLNPQIGLSRLRVNYLTLISRNSPPTFGLQYIELVRMWVMEYDETETVYLAPIRKKVSENNLWT